MGFPSCPPLSHPHTDFLSLLVFKGLQIPWGPELGVSECLGRILITSEQLERDSVLRAAF